MKCVVVLLVALAAAAVSGFQYTEEWEAWKEEHGKVYESDEIEQRRYAIWESNMKYVNEHNARADESGFTVEINEFADLETNEFNQIYNGFVEDDDSDDAYSDDIDSDDIDSNSTLMWEPDEADNDLTLPRSVDWRRRGAVTPVKKQRHCRSCYAFSATGALEGQFKIHGKRLVSLSEQQIVDCSGKYHNNGCHGGRYIRAFKYLKHRRGLQSERSYPYRARQQRCKYNRRKVVVGCKGYRRTRKNSERALKRAVARKGPISVAIDASHWSFKHYKRGVYNYRGCSSTKLNHAVLVVGYGVRRGKRYWLVKNSWGKRWGMNGYIMMSRNRNNQCGIAKIPAYPLVNVMNTMHDYNLLVHFSI